MYKRILLAVDGSENSLRAARQASWIAKASAGAIELVYVADFSRSKNTLAQPEGDNQRDHQLQQRLLPAETLLNGDGVQHEVTILRGEPGPSIISYANANAFDLIVIGSRGLNQLQEMMLGSVSHKVMKRAHCPVLVVK
ncbi:universal stress protein [Bhargavaea cecembensis]|uniref:universal stress protein n=1 Tax=Bhargavaea cecembensis TaxID=394098 RepID=UPI00058F50E8|nr:universal stress protein [Bhargavaea cecembensis]